jgi:AbrB family looped-hinge helix DNA binding protein
MRISSRGQVTIPAGLRLALGFQPGDEVDVIADGDTLRVLHTAPAATRGERIVERMRGRATTDLSTDDLVAMLRDTPDERTP